MNDSPEQASAFVREMGWTFPVGIDGTGEIANAYQVSSIPTTVFLASDGTVANTRVGGLADADFSQEVAKISR